MAQQHPQAAVMAAQPPSGFPQPMPGMQFNSPQAIQGQMGGRSGGRQAQPLVMSGEEACKMVVVVLLLLMVVRMVMLAVDLRKQSKKKKNKVELC